MSTALCPVCGKDIRLTERRPDGNSICVHGHTVKNCDVIRDVKGWPPPEPEVERFSPCMEYDCAYMDMYSKGDYVKYDDYLLLKKKYDALVEHTRGM